MSSLAGHEDKCNILLFHPMASSLLATAACDGTVLIWDLDKKEVKISLDPLPEPVSGVCVCVCVCVFLVCVCVVSVQYVCETQQTYHCQIHTYTAVCNSLES